MKDIRLLPLVILAIGALLALKGAGLLAGGQQMMGGGPALARDAGADQPPQTGPAEAETQATAGEGEGPAEAHDTAQEAEQNAGKSSAEAKADEPSLLQRVLGGGSRSREAILESLAERREELDAREKEMDLRENLLQAAEQRVEERIAELKALESRITAADSQRTEADDERMKNLVVMYETMKPKDAARIFNNLDLSVVVEVARLMSARQMALVLAEMDSPVAQRLTLALSARPADPVAAAGAGGELPQIVGTHPAE